MSKNKAEIAKQLELTEGNTIDFLGNVKVLSGSIRENKKNNKFMSNVVLIE